MAQAMEKAWAQEDKAKEEEMMRRAVAESQAIA